MRRKLWNYFVRIDLQAMQNSPSFKYYYFNYFFNHYSVNLLSSFTSIHFLFSKQFATKMIDKVSWLQRLVKAGETGKTGKLNRKCPLQLGQVFVYVCACVLVAIALARTKVVLTSSPTHSSNPHTIMARQFSLTHAIAIGIGKEESGTTALVTALEVSVL